MHVSAGPQQLESPHGLKVGEQQSPFGPTHVSPLSQQAVSLQAVGQQGPPPLLEYPGA
jgi:hypothetical protein